jgi:hypothetical protein
MGADGHVRFYSEKKLVETFDQELVESFFEHFGSSVMYRHTLNDNAYITRYDGDNLYGTTDFYNFVLSCYNPTTKQINSQNWDYDAYSEAYWMKLSQKQKNDFYEIIKFMESDCFIKSIEVWT